MFHDPRDYPFTVQLEAAWKQVRAELDALRPEDFFDWYQPDAYDGLWQVCGLHVVSHPEAKRVDPDVQRRCPRTVELVRSVPGVQWSAFSVLGPGTIVHPHSDADHVGGRSLRAHLCVKAAPGCLFQIENEQRDWEEGRTIVFDGKSQHAVWNNSGVDRVVVMLEFLPESAG